MIKEQIIVPVSITMTDDYTCSSECKFYKYTSRNYYEGEPEKWYCILFGEVLKEETHGTGNKIFRCKKCEEYSKLNKMKKILQ